MNSPATVVDFPEIDVDNQTAGRPVDVDFRSLIEPKSTTPLTGLRRLVAAAKARTFRRLFRWLGFFFSEDKFWGLLEVSGITIFVGPNGSGKSLCAVASTLGVLEGKQWDCDQPSHRHHQRFVEHLVGCPEFCVLEHDHLEPCSSGCSMRYKDRADWCDDGVWAFLQGMYGVRLVYSTVPLLDDDGEHHHLYRRLEDYRQLITIEHADVLFDEVSGISDAGDSAQIPAQVKLWMHTLRKADVRLRVTTPAYARCAKPIRQVAQVLVDARAFVAEPAVAGRLWRPRMAMIFRAYDATKFVDYKPGSSERIKPICSTTFWRPGSEASRRYDTLGQVTPLGHVTETGMCSACGGTRRAPACSCTPESDAHGGEMTVLETVTTSGTRTRRAIPLEDVTGEPSTKPVTAVVGSLVAKREPQA